MPAQLSSWLNAATAVALAIAVGIIVKDRAEVATPVTAAVIDDSQRARVAKLEQELTALSTMPRSSESNQADMVARLELLKGEMAKLSGQVSSSVAPALTSVTADPIEQERQEHDFNQRAIATLENSLASEPMDPSGSMAAASDISNAVQGSAFEKTQVGEVQCRATLCRIDVSHGDPQAEMQFTQSLNQIEAFRESEGFVQFLPRSDGGVDTVVYVSRAGHHLPVPPRS